MKNMKTYIGTKIIKATPMTRKEYNEYRGWEIPENENPNEEVYLVEYPKDEFNKPNHSNHEGYISMSPKNVFEKYYKEIDNNSFGAKRVGADFNPSKSLKVDLIKQKTAEIIDLLEDENDFSIPEKNRLIKLAQANYEIACMLAEKSNFK